MQGSRTRMKVFAALWREQKQKLLTPSPANRFEFIEECPA